MSSGAVRERYAAAPCAHGAAARARAARRVLVDRAPPYCICQSGTVTVATPRPRRSYGDGGTAVVATMWLLRLHQAAMMMALAAELATCGGVPPALSPGTVSTVAITINTSQAVGRTASGHVGLVFDGYTSDQHDPLRTHAWAKSNWVQANFSCARLSHGKSLLVRGGVDWNSPMLRRSCPVSPGAQLAI
jgi:hypothetical protein